MKPTEEREPGRGAAAFMAVLMHLLFFILLIFGINWQSKHPQVTTVDLWSDVPSPPQPIETPKPVPEVKVPPPPPLETKPESKPEVAPEPKPEPKPEAKPEPVKPDILLKEKAEKERIEKEKAEKEKLKLEQQRKLEAKRKIEADHQRQIKEQMAKEDEARQNLKDKEDAMKVFQADQAAAQDRLVKDYIDKIRAKIRDNVAVPQDIQGNPKAVYKVKLLPDGSVLSAKLEKSSGVAAYDSAIERAIYKAQLLPLPPDPALFQNFRELELQFQPNE